MFRIIMVVFSFNLHDLILPKTKFKRIELSFSKLLSTCVIDRGFFCNLWRYQVLLCKF